MKADYKQLTISDMAEADIGEVLAIEQTVFLSPWTENMFRRELRLPMSHILTARAENDEIIGYVTFWVVADEVHLHGLAVRKDWQRRGVASVLMGEMIRRSQAEGALTAILEVRPSNTPARRLYGKFDFRVCGIRPSYYTDSGEDALILRAELRERHGDERKAGDKKERDDRNDAR